MATYDRWGNDISVDMGDDPTGGYFWGSLGLPGQAVYDKEGYEVRSADEGSPRFVTIGGREYARVGEDRRRLAQDPTGGQIARYADQIFKDPTYGWVEPKELYGEIVKEQQKRTAEAFDPSPYILSALAGAGMGFALGPGFSGFEAMGTAIPGMAPGTTAWGALTGDGGPLNSLRNFISPSQSAPPDSYWNTMADAGGALNDASPTGAGALDFSLSAPGSGIGGVGTGGLSIPTSAASEFALVPSGSGLGLGGVGTAGLSIPAAAGGGGASAADSFFSGLFAPKNLLGAGLSLGSALLQNSAVGKAVDAQTGAADRATAATLAMFNQNREDLAPWREAGGGAVRRLSDMLTPGKQLTTLEMDPGYQFRLDEGTKAVERSAAARGKLFSGETGKALTRFGQNFATGEFTNATNRLANLAGLGQTAATNTANLGANAAQQTAANTIGAGNARASGYIGGANAFAGGLSNFLRGMQEEDILRAIMGTRYA